MLHGKEKPMFGERQLNCIADKYWKRKPGAVVHANGILEHNL